MKTSVLVGLLATSAAAAPASLHARDTPDGPTGAAAGATAAAPAPAAGGLDLSAILGNLDMSKIGEMLQGVDMSKIGDLMQNIDMSKIGDIMANLDMSKIGSLLGGLGLGAAPAAGAAAGAAPAAPAGGMDISKGISNYFGGGAAVQKAYKIEEIKPVLRPTAKRVKIVYGPYKIKGTDNKEKVGNFFSMDPAGTGYSYAAGDDFPRDITIIDVQSGVTDENFVPIDIGKGLYNHHNVFYDMSKPVTTVTTCQSGKSAFSVPISIFMGGATESSTIPYTSMDGGFNSGYYLSKDAKVSQMIDIVNYNKADQNVYVVSEMEYVPGKIADALPATSQVIDIGQCSAAGAGFAVHPPNSETKQWTINSGNITMAQNGYFLAGKAHFHDGAVSMNVWLNNQPVCKSVAEYGGAGREGINPDGSKWEGLAGTTFCDKVIEVKKGDILRLSADFDVAKHPERQFEGGEKAEHGAMAAMPGMGSSGGDEGMAEGMALYTVSFAQEMPGTNPKYSKFTAM